jgi:DNA-binding transcriptional MerR regulator
MAAMMRGIWMDSLWCVVGSTADPDLAHMLAVGCGADVEAGWVFHGRCGRCIDSDTSWWQYPLVTDGPRHSLTELADLAGVTPRTVRYYLAQGLLPGVGQTGPGSKYDDGHLARLRLIKRLQAEHLPLAEIRHQLDGLADEQILELAGNPAPAPPIDSALEYVRTILGESVRGPGAPARQMRSPASFATLGVSLASEGTEPHRSSPVPMSSGPAVPPVERSQWERIALAPDIELHIRRPLSRAQNKGVDRLVTIARELLEEDRP